MAEGESVALFVNEAAADAGGGDLERQVGGMPGVLAVEVGGADPTGEAPGPAMVKRATITYDPAATDAQELRSGLESLGYAVTSLGDLGT